MVNVGDRLVVQGISQAAYVEKVWYDEANARIVIELDWKEFGKSRVYGHDENKVWFKYTNAN